MKTQVNGIWRDHVPPLWIISETISRTNFSYATNQAIRLIDIHDRFTKQQRGRPSDDLDALKRGALILTVTAWESFVEATVSEIFNARLQRASAPSDIQSTFNFAANDWLAPNTHTRLTPPELQKWTGHEWKERIRDSFNEYLRHFNTPNTKNVRTLFKRYVGIDDITRNWSWSGTPQSAARERLDRLIHERGDAVHRAKTYHPLSTPEPGVKRATVIAALNLCYNLVVQIEDRLGVARTCRKP